MNRNVAMRSTVLALVCAATLSLRSEAVAQQQKNDPAPSPGQPEDCGPYPRSSDEFAQSMIAATTAIRKNDAASALPAIEAAQRQAQYPNERASVDGLRAMYANTIGDLRAELDGWVSLRAWAARCPLGAPVLGGLDQKIAAIRQKIPSSGSNGEPNH